MRLRLKVPKRPDVGDPLDPGSALAAITWENRRLRRWAIILTFFSLIAGGGALARDLDTRSQLSSSEMRATLCQRGDLYACRVSAGNLRYACSPRALAVIPKDRLRTELARCGLADPRYLPAPSNPDR